MKLPPDSGTPSTPLPDQLTGPVARLLRPLVRLMIQSGVTFPVFADLVRQIYVEVAAGEVAAGETAPTHSRVSLVTGIHRKEVKRLLNAKLPVSEAPKVATLTSEILAHWSGGKTYTDKKGRPLPLPRLARADGKPSFVQLVEAVTRDLRPRTVLDNWMKMGLVKLDAQDRVHLEIAAFLPKQGSDEQLFYFGRNLHDHIAAASANVSAPDKPPFFDRSVHYDQLSPAAALALETLGRARAQELLLEINRSAVESLGAEAVAAEMPKGAPTQRFNLGVYLYVESEPEDP